MLKHFCRKPLLSAGLVALLIGGSGLGCSSEKEVTVSAEDMQRQLDQLSPEQREQIQKSQEAIATTAAQLPTQGMSEQQQAERNEALQRAMPMPPPR